MEFLQVITLMCSINVDTHGTTTSHGQLFKERVYCVEYVYKCATKKANNNAHIANQRIIQCAKEYAKKVS